VEGGAKSSGRLRVNVSSQRMDQRGIRGLSGLALTPCMEDSESSCAGLPNGFLQQA
jgi:hypothetical protein